MLFSVKNKTVHSLILTLVFASVSLLLKYHLGLEWNLHIGEAALGQIVFALGFILASDLVVSTILVIVFHTAYVRLSMELAEYFRRQSRYAILAGGLLAASEEMFFRGVLLEYMIGTLDTGVYYAVIVSAIIFGLFHIIRNKRLALFSLWAFWEGVVLGAIYLYTDSLPVTMAVHAAHDIAGFALFSLQRRRGFLVLKKHTGF
jgi:membrane protease YdiL (CAAX protease family)